MAVCGGRSRQLEQSGANIFFYPFSFLFTHFIFFLQCGGAGQAGWCGDLFFYPFSFLQCGGRQSGAKIFFFFARFIFFSSVWVGGAGRVVRRFVFLPVFFSFLR